MKLFQQIRRRSSLGQSSLLSVASVLGVSNVLLCCATQQHNVRLASDRNRAGAEDVVRIPHPEDNLECPVTGPKALTWSKAPTGEFSPSAGESRPQNWDQPPQSQVELQGGALVAIDHGEFAESGLFWRAEGTQTLLPVEVALEVPIRRVFHTADGIVGVAGLCHGGGPFVTKLVSLVATDTPAKWDAQVIANVRGCPAVVQVNPYDDSMVIATAEGEGLVSASQSKTTVVATWPANYHPKELHISRANGSEVVGFYLGFGKVLAVFQNGKGSWYTVRGCAGTIQK